MTKVLFVVPPYRTTDQLPARLYPMPLAATSLSAVLLEAGYGVVLKDFLQTTVPMSLRSIAPRPACFAGKKAPNYIHYGAPIADVKDWLIKNCPSFDVVCLCMCPCNVWALSTEIAKCIKATGARLVVGGPYVTTAVEEVMANTGADVAVVGEGESVIIEAVEMAAAGGGGVIRGVPMAMADLPLPAWQLAPPKTYPKVGGLVRGVLTISRGCPYRCSFCCVHTIMGRKYRRQKRDRIRTELLRLHGFGVRYFSFLDDNLFISKGATNELLDIIDELKREVDGFAHAKFYVEEGIEIRIAAIPGLVKRINAAGFKDMALGLETMNNKRLKDIQKPYTPIQREAALKECQAAGFTPRAFYIIGLPGDSVESVCRDLVEFGKTGLDVRPNNLKLYPGTEVTKEYKRRGFIDDSYDWRLSSFYTPDTDEISFAEIRKLKAVLSGIGTAAGRFGIRLFSDGFGVISQKLKEKKYDLRREEDGALVLEGNMFKSGPVKNMLKLLVIKEGAVGAKVVKLGEKSIKAIRLQKPADVAQAGVASVLHGYTPPKRRRDLF